MQIDKQLFEDVLSGKLKGIFVLRNGKRFNDNLLTNIYNTTVVVGKTTYYFNGKPIVSDYKGIVDIIDFIPNTNMKENELTIEIPNGKIVDWDEVKKQNKIVLKDSPNEPNLSYGDVCRKLFGNQQHYHIIHDGHIEVADFYRCNTEPNAAKTRHQLECILAKNQLANIAVYLNNSWKPTYQSRVTLRLHPDDKIVVGTEHTNAYFTDNGQILFKSPKAAQQAIEILGEETVKLALEPLGI